MYVSTTGHLKRVPMLAGTFQTKPPAQPPLPPTNPAALIQQQQQAQQRQHSFPVPPSLLPPPLTKQMQAPPQQIPLQRAAEIPHGRPVAGQARRALLLLLLLAQPSLPVLLLLLLVVPPVKAQASGSAPAAVPPTGQQKIPTAPQPLKSPLQNPGRLGALLVPTLKSYRWRRQNTTLGLMTRMGNSHPRQLLGRPNI